MGLKRGKTIGLAALLAVAAPLSLPINASSEVFELSSLTNLYGPVSFDHDMHSELVSGNCSVCHHHTAGTPSDNPNCISCHKNSPEAESPACSSCHAIDPFSSANLEAIAKNPLLHHKVKPSLKAAYHQYCLDCHMKNEAPSGCQDCHVMTEKGQKFYNTGPYAPKPGKTGEHHE